MKTRATRSTSRSIAGTSNWSRATRRRRPTADSSPHAGLQRSASTAGQKRQRQQRRGFSLPLTHFDACLCLYRSARRGGAVLERTTSVCGSVTDSGAPLPWRISSSSRTVPSPICRIGCATVVSGGSSVAREADVVEADEGEIVRDAQLAASCRVDDAHRHLVVEAEDRRRRVPCVRAAARRPPRRTRSRSRRSSR